MLQRVYADTGAIVRSSRRELGIMPTRKARPDEHGRIGIADMAFISMADILALAGPAPGTLDENVTGKAVKLTDDRVVVSQDGGGETVEYVIAFSVTRSPKGEAEIAACKRKADAGLSKKAADKAAAQAVVQDVIERTNREMTERVALVERLANAGADRATDAVGKAFGAIVKTVAQPGV